MRYSKLLTYAVPLLALGACGDDDGITVQGPPPPAATVRVVNAGVDAGTVDFRFIDIVENLPSLQGVPVRSYSGMYQRTEPGTRATRVFPNSTNPDTTSIFLVDQAVPLSAGTRYTMVYSGRWTGNAPEAERQRLTVLTDPAAPTPPAGQIALKALHTVVGVGPVDVYIVPVASTTAATPGDFATVNAGVIRNLGYLTQSAYTTVPVRPSGTFYRFVVTAANSTTPLFAVTPNQPGTAAPAGASYGPQPGMQISGSVMTLVVAPGTTPGTRGSTAANQTPTVFVMIDKVLDPS